ncbi:MAG: hypothetical protein OEZ65_06865 [Gemmatimonadota bacterium]|nr:hypothetical protein [Gemmatimonadota bacterium]MDH5759293.1 hypothetical protein [Gemmatimonadota bacterium]
MSDAAERSPENDLADSRNRTSLRRMVAEFAVISIGVLTALTADASWDWWLERGEEREALAQLLVDFRSNVAQLDSAGTTHERSLDASYELLAMAKGMGSRQGTDAPEMLVYRLSNVFTYDPDLGGLNSLIASGRLGIIRNDSLRIALAAWPDLVEDLGENEREEWRHSFDILQPYLVEKGVRLETLHSIGGLRRLSATGEAVDYSPVLDDPRFAQLLGSRIVHLHDLLDEVETVRRAIQDIVRLIETS